MVDYIIVGGGSAGCVLASRLSADPAAKVVLLEAGGWDKSPFIHMPSGFFPLMKSGKYDWRYHTAPQRHLDNRIMYWPRGKVMGGSSATNGLVYIRGNAADYDDWARDGNRNWSYAECLPYFRRAESWAGETDAFHGTDGPLHTSRHGITHPLAVAFVEAGVQAGFPSNNDFNGARQEGFGPCDSTLSLTGRRPRRSSTAQAYLHPVRQRPNLTIIPNALVTRIIVERGRAIGVDYVVGRQQRRLQADGEIILAAGSVNSPQLLQLSGIGAPAHLEPLGIKVEVALGGVGENLQDHLAGGLKHRVSWHVSVLPWLRPMRAAWALCRYMVSGEGPAAYHGVEALAFVKTHPQALVPELQYHLILIMYEDHGRTIIPEHGFMPYFNITRPKSRGSIKISSSDPFKPPVIDPHYFAEPDDRRIMREGIRIARDIVAQQAFDPYRGEEYAPGKTARSDADLDTYLRANTETIYHPVGTCKMGHDDMAVVDDRLRVHGLEGLRVVDASIMPTVPTGNTNAAAIMIAEKGADFIMNTHKFHEG